MYLSWRSSSRWCGGSQGSIHGRSVNKGLVTLLGPQSRFGDSPVKFQVVCPLNGTAVLNPCRTDGLITLPSRTHVSLGELIALVLLFLYSVVLSTQRLDTYSFWNRLTLVA